MVKMLCQLFEKKIPHKNDNAPATGRLFAAATAPGVPLGLSDKGLPTIKNRLIHDRLELRVLPIAVSLICSINHWDYLDHITWTIPKKQRLKELGLPLQDLPCSFDSNSEQNKLFQSILMSAADEKAIGRFAKSLSYFSGIHINL